jgi:hypothetical protein
MDVFFTGGPYPPNRQMAQIKPVNPSLEHCFKAVFMRSYAYTELNHQK